MTFNIQTMNTLTLLLRHQCSTHSSNIHAQLGATHYLLPYTLPNTSEKIPFRLLLMYEGLSSYPSDYFHLIFPPSPPLLPVLQPPWWHFSKTLIWHHHYHVFRYIYSLLTEKGICVQRNILFKF